jgi:hypothetical protein
MWARNGDPFEWVVDTKFSSHETVDVLTARIGIVFVLMTDVDSVRLTPAF